MTQEKKSISDYTYREIRFLIDKGEMPECVRKEILDALPLVKNEECNDPYHFRLVNINKRRYFKAVRITDATRYGGSSISYWRISYGKLQYRLKTNVIGTADFEWVFGEQFGKVGDVEIPKQVHTKKEVLEIAKKLSHIFNN